MIVYIQSVAKRKKYKREIPVHVLVETHGALHDAWEIAQLPARAGARLRPHGLRERPPRRDPRLQHALARPVRAPARRAREGATSSPRRSPTAWCPRTTSRSTSRTPTTSSATPGARATTSGSCACGASIPSQIQPIVDAMKPDLNEVADGRRDPARGAEGELGPDPVRGRAARPRHLPLLLGAPAEGPHHRRDDARGRGAGLLRLEGTDDDHDPRREIPRRPEGREAPAGARRDQRLPRDPRQGLRLQGDLPLRRRRGRGLAGPARPRHLQPGRRAHRRAPHHRRLRPAAAGGRGHRLRRERLQRRAHREVAHQVRRGRDAHRGPGGRQALRPPARQGAGHAAGDGRPHQGRRRREDRPRLLHHGAHRRARRRGPGGRDRPRLRLRRGRRRRHLPRGDHRPRHVPQVRRRGEGADPRQHHRVRQDAALHASRSSPPPTWPSRSIRSRPSAP